MRSRRGRLRPSEGDLNGGVTDRTGQALTEFVLVLPILLILIFGIIEFGLAFRTYQIVTNSAREGARVAVIPSSDTGDVEAAVRDRLLSSGLDTGNPGLEITFRCNGAEGAICSNTGDTTEVEVAFPYRFFVLGPVADFVCGGGCGEQFGEVLLRTASTMRTE
jgi:hypothetical protein